MQNTLKDIHTHTHTHMSHIVCIVFYTACCDGLKRIIDRENPSWSGVLKNRYLRELLEYISFYKTDHGLLGMRPDFCDDHQRGWVTAA